MSSKPVVHPRPPSVETVLKVLRQRHGEIIDDADESGALVAVARTTIDDERTRLGAGEPPRSIEAMADAAEELLDLYLDPHAAVPEPVINATGVILHTNLGRATWPDVAVEAVGLAAGWGMLELDPADRAAWATVPPGGGPPRRLDRCGCRDGRQQQRGGCRHRRRLGGYGRRHRVARRARRDRWRRPDPRDRRTCGSAPDRGRDHESHTHRGLRTATSLWRRAGRAACPSVQLHDGRLRRGA